MEHIINIHLRSIDSVEQLQKFSLGRAVMKEGILYFHLLESGGFVAHVVSKETDGEWIRRMIERNRIYVPRNIVEAEMR